MAESVWDYPRPPRVEPSARRVRVEFGGVVVADSAAALRVLETSQAPAIYVPPADVDFTALEPSGHRTWCEWKGRATYYDLVAAGERSPRAAWAYPTTTEGYEALVDHVAFYPQRAGACYLDDELVAPNQGDFYGGWITADIEGPFKGGPGSRGW